MGQDDENEGHADGECLEHVWQFREVLLVPGQGAMRQYGCTRCPAETFRARSQIR